MENSRPENMDRCRRLPAGEQGDRFPGFQAAQPAGHTVGEQELG